MKKLVAILVILVVCVGAITAIDNAAVKVSVSVPEYVPTFRLATSDSVNIETAVFDVVEENGSSVPAETTASATANALLAAGSDLTIKFGVIQLNNSIGYLKTTNTYTFEVTASDLVLTGYTSDTAASNQKFLKKGTISFSSTDNTPSETYADVTAASTFAVKYNGAKYTPAAVSEIATFSVTWAGNDSAVSGTYIANIILSLSTT